MKLATTANWWIERKLAQPPASVIKCFFKFFFILFHISYHLIACSSLCFELSLAVSQKIFISFWIISYCAWCLVLAALWHYNTWWSLLLSIIEILKWDPMWIKKSIRNESLTIESSETNLQEKQKTTSPLSYCGVRLYQEAFWPCWRSCNVAEYCSQRRSAIESHQFSISSRSCSLE
jgi:hypothetical protein